MNVSPDNNLFLIILTQKRRFATCYEKIIKNDKRSNSNIFAKEKLDSFARKRQVR